MNKGKYLAIDHGDRRIGLAISDFDKLIAFPRDFLEYDNEDEVIDLIKQFCEGESVSKVIVGFPIEMDGTVGDRAKVTYKFGSKLKKALETIPLEYYDERLTTKQSIRKLQQQGIKAKEQKGQLDMVSAQIILEAYLAQQTNQ